MPYPDNFDSEAFNRVWGGSDLESDVVEIGLRAEYAEYLANKNNPQIDFLDWASDIPDYVLSELDRKQIAEAKAEKARTMQAKLNNWIKGSAVIDDIIIENHRAAKSEINSFYDLEYENVKAAIALGAM